MDRTIVVHLHPTPEQAINLQKTLAQYTACYNAVTQEGFTTQCSNGVDLHKRTYYPLRAQYPDLPAQLVCAARVKATESIKSALTWRKKYDKNYPKRVAKAQKGNRPIPMYKPLKAPHSQLSAMRYDARSYWVKWESRTASIATLAGRVHLTFTVPQYALPYLVGKPCSADLCYRKGRYSLHIVVNIPEPHVERSDGVIGVDLGLNRPDRRSQSLFLCRTCGYCLNADLNASYNIWEKYLASLADFGTSFVGGFAVKEPIASTLGSETQAPRL